MVCYFLMGSASPVHVLANRSMLEKLSVASLKRKGICQNGLGHKNIISLIGRYLIVTDITDLYLAIC